MAIPWHQSAPRHELKDRPSDLASNGAGQSSRGIEPGRLLFPVPSPAVAFRSPFSSSPALPPPPHLQIILQRQPGRATATVMRLKGRRRCGIGASLPGRRGLGSLHAPVRLVFVPTTPATAGGAALLHSTATPPPLPPAAADASLLSRHMVTTTSEPSLASRLFARVVVVIGEFHGGSADRQLRNGCSRRIELYARIGVEHEMPNDPEILVGILLHEISDVFSKILLLIWKCQWKHI